MLILARNAWGLGTFLVDTAPSQYLCIMGVYNISGLYTCVYIYIYNYIIQLFLSGGSTQLAWLKRNYRIAGPPKSEGLLGEGFGFWGVLFRV